MLKDLKKLAIEGTYFNITKTSNDTGKAKIILNGGKSPYKSTEKKILYLFKVLRVSD